MITRAGHEAALPRAAEEPREFRWAWEGGGHLPARGGHRAGVTVWRGGCGRRAEAGVFGLSVWGSKRPHTESSDVQATRVGCRWAVARIRVFSRGRWRRHVEVRDQHPKLYAQDVPIIGDHERGLDECLYAISRVTVHRIWRRTQDLGVGGELHVLMPEKHLFVELLA